MDETDTRSVARQPAAPDQPPILDEEYARLYGEPLSRALDLTTWQADPDPAGLYSRLTDEVRQALAHERAAQDLVRRDLFPHLASRPGAPPGAGVYRAPAALLERIQRGLLFRGAVEAAAGVSVVYETVPLGVVQLGVCLVSYRGDERDPVYYHVPKGAATEPTLTAWGVRYARAAGPARIGEQIGRALAWTEAARAPFALLFSAEDLA